jgi:arylsulfatase A-like enzyme
MGYFTAYVGSQNLRYEDFGAFLERASIDVLVSAADLGGAGDPHLGAPDENATARLLGTLTEAQAGGKPYFAVLHLSNTHWPYRVDPSLEPFTPHDANPLGKAPNVHNHYRNSVLMQERTVSEFLGKLRAMPGWDDTAVVFVSDHGEEFREHGGMYHLSSLFDEQVRTPGWMLTGRSALTPQQARALAVWHGRRTFTRDVNATILDLLGALDARPGFPFASRLEGRSLLRFPRAAPSAVPLSTQTGVWEPDDPKYGVMQDDVLVVRSASAHWRCFDGNADPTQHRTTTGPLCEQLEAVGGATFAGLP